MEVCRKKHLSIWDTAAKNIVLSPAVASTSAAAPTSTASLPPEGIRKKSTAKRKIPKTSPKKAVQDTVKSPDPKKKKADQISQQQTDESTEEWKKVKRRKKTNKNKESGKMIRPRASAIIIERNTAGISYADILRAVKTNEQPKDLGETVKTLRTTRNEGLLLELKKSNTAESTSCRSAIEKALGDMAKVNLSAHRVTIQCWGLIAELNTDDELLEAIEAQAQVKRPDLALIRSRRNTYGGTQAVYISLPAEDAKKVLSLRHIKIG